MMKSVLSPLLAGFLFATAVIPSATLWAQQPATDAAAEMPIGLNYVPENAIAVTYLKTDTILQSPSVQQQAVEVATAAGRKYFGFDPMQITQMTIVVAPQPADYVAENPDDTELTQTFAVVRTSDTLNEETFFARLLEMGSTLEVVPQEDIAEEMPQLKGTVFLIEDLQIGFLTAHILDEHTFLIGQSNLTDQLVTGGPHAELTTPAKQFLQEYQGAEGLSVIFAAPIRAWVNQQIAENGLPPEMEAYKNLPNDTESIVARVKYTDQLSVSLKVNATDEAAAKRLESQVLAAIDSHKEAILSQAQIRQQSADEMEAALGKYQARVVTAMFDKVTPKREGKSLALTAVFRDDDLGGWDLALAGVLTTIMLPEVEAPTPFQ